MSTLSKEAIQARKDYFREWRAKNKDKKREYNRSYWERKAEETKQQKEN